LEKKMRELAIHGMPKRYLHTNIGYNSRLDSLQSAILNVKLIRLNKWIKQRKKLADNYINYLSNIKHIKLPLACSLDNIGHSWNQFVIRILDNSFEMQQDELVISSNSKNRDVFKNKLERLGVSTIIYYPIPIHLQPAYKHLGYKKGSLPITEEICDQVISLPIFPEMELTQQLYVIEAIQKIYNK